MSQMMRKGGWGAKKPGTEGSRAFGERTATGRSRDGLPRAAAAMGQGAGTGETLSAVGKSAGTSAVCSTLPVAAHSVPRWRSS